MSSAKQVVSDLAAKHPDGLWAQEALEAFLDEKGVGAGPDMPNPATVRSEPTPEGDPDKAKRVYARATVDYFTGVRGGEYDAEALGVPGAEVQDLRDLLEEFNEAWVDEFGEHQPHSHGKRPARQA